MKTGKSQWRGLLAGACSPRFYPPEVAVPDVTFTPKASRRTRRASASAGGKCSAIRRSTPSSPARWNATAIWRRPPRASKRRGPNSGSCGRNTCRRSGSVCRPEGNTPQPRESCRPTPPNRPSRGRLSAVQAAARQTGGQGRNRRLGVGARRNAAVAGGRGGDDLLHAARIRAQPRRSPGAPSNCGASRRH